MKVFTLSIRPPSCHVSPLCNPVLVRGVCIWKCRFSPVFTTIPKMTQCRYRRKTQAETEKWMCACWPFEERSGPPDVGVSHAAPRRLRDVLLLKQLLQRLSHHRNGVRDVRRLVFTINQLEAQQACNTHTHNTHIRMHTHTHTQQEVKQAAEWKLPSFIQTS